MVLQFNLLDRIPDFRLATMGGTSKARADFLGKGALYVGWASWHESREFLPALEKFQAERGRVVEVVTIAFDVQGPQFPMKYLAPAHFTHTALIDACCELSRLWGMKDIPFSVLCSQDGVVQKIGGAPDKAFLGDLARDPWEIAMRLWPVENKKPTGFQKSEFLLQSCTNLLSRERKEDAVAALAEAHRLDPENRLIRPQMEAIAHPEKVYGVAASETPAKRKIRS